MAFSFSPLLDLTTVKACLFSMMSVLLYSAENFSEPNKRRQKLDFPAADEPVSNTLICLNSTTFLSFFALFKYFVIIDIS